MKRGEVLWCSVLNLIKQKFTDDKIFEVKSPDWSLYKNNIGDKLPITSLVDISKLKPYGQEYFGVHPIHGSTTGMNFFVNPLKNMWHCFRHNSGGDALALFSLLKGIRICEDFKKEGRKLKGEDFFKTIATAEKEYNIIILDKKLYEQIKNIDPQFQVKVISAKELSEMDIPVPSWIVECWIPEESLVIIAGKTGAMKSFLATVMGFCSIYGMNFLGKFATKKGLWLYIDQDNPIILTKDRNKKILMGLGVDAPDEFKYICQNGLKLDIEEHIRVLEDIIKSYNPSVVVLDSLVRFLSKSDENASLDISNIFSKLRVLSSKYKTSFFIIHHLRKSSKDSQSEDQDERVRGSSDIVNAVDCLLIISRKDKSSPYINVKQEKNRYDKELEPFVVLINQDASKEGISFEVTAIDDQSQSMASKASKEIFIWLKERKWEDDKNKIFKTKEVIDKFEGVFHTNLNRNRKIIYEALDHLCLGAKIHKTESKGYWMYTELIEFDNTKSQEGEPHD